MKKITITGIVNDPAEYRIRGLVERAFPKAAHGTWEVVVEEVKLPDGELAKPAEPPKYLYERNFNG